MEPEISARPNFAQALTIETKISIPCTANKMAGMGDVPKVAASNEAAKAATQMATKRERGGTDKSRAIANKSNRFCWTDAVVNRGVWVSSVCMCPCSHLVL